MGGRISGVENGSDPFGETGGLDGSEGGLDDLLDRLEAEARESEGINFRKHERVRFRKSVVLILQLHYPGRSEKKFRVQARDISASGIAFLHRAEIHEGTRCVVNLIEDRERGIKIPGAIVRCENVGTRRFDVGVLFDKLVDLSAYFDVDMKPLDL